MKQRVERRLSAVEGFAEPRVELEQYATPADIAAHLLHVARMQGDLERVVIDLGTGTGMLALAAALSGAPRVVGVDLDAAALELAGENAACVAPDAPLDFVRGDVAALPLALDDPVTVVSNPPFGAQRQGADRPFLRAAADHAAVSYTVHNDGSRAFVESFASDHGGTVTHAFAVDFPLPHQFDFHTAETGSVRAEVFRIEW